MSTTASDNSGTDSLDCKVCSISFPKEYHRQFHYKWVHEEIHHTCDICKSNFRRLTTFNDHIKARPGNQCDTPVMKRKLESLKKNAILESLIGTYHHFCQCFWTVKKESNFNKLPEIHPMTLPMLTIKRIGKNWTIVKKSPRPIQQVNQNKYIEMKLIVDELRVQIDDSFVMEFE